MECKTLSIIIPTYNSSLTIKECLNSIDMQIYDKNLIEIIIVDADSKDDTVDIAKQYADKIIDNPLQTGEAGKALGLKEAKNEIVALIDSDNILPNREWIRMMMEPFEDDEIIGSEPIKYTLRKNDGLITRYCALIGMNDPICMFIGNYDRWNYLKEKWTEMPVSEQGMGNYLKVALDSTKLPTIGANGFMVRRKATLAISIDDYLFDIDMVWELLQSNYTINGKLCNKISKVKTGIVHIFSGNLKTFYKKQKRRINDYLFFSIQGKRKYPWKNQDKKRLFKFIIYTVLVFPLLIQSVNGYNKKRDNAWYFHPIACLITLWVYGFYSIKGKIFDINIRRNNWSQ